MLQKKYTLEWSHNEITEGNPSIDQRATEGDQEELRDQEKSQHGSKTKATTKNQALATTSRKSKQHNRTFKVKVIQETVLFIPYTPNCKKPMRRSEEMQNLVGSEL